MVTTSKGISRLWIPGFALIGLGLVGCISDDSDPGGDSGGSGGSSGSGGSTSGSGGTTGGSSGSSGSGGSGATPSGTKCAAPTAIPSSKPGIADFEVYDGTTSLKTWYFNLGGDASTGVQAGTFGYGDDAVGTDGQPEPEFFQMVDGNDSTYALSISDTEADDYGGGMGLWLSNCLDASAFSGISFWVRGNTPMGDAKLSVFMEETTSNMPAAGGALGTCPGIDSGDAPTCVHPSIRFPITDAWTEQRIAWSALTPGVAAGTQVVPDGHNIWQIQLGVELIWVDDGTGTYVPTPAPYEVAIDTVTFY